MSENESNNKFYKQRLPETGDGETGEENDFLRIRRFQLKKEQRGTLLGIDVGIDMLTEQPAVIRIPAQAARCAIGLVVRTLGLELVIDYED